MKQKTDLIVDGKVIDRDPAAEAAMRALEKFASHGGLLPREEIDEILREDTLIH
jgi:hypothetical protein